MSLLERLKPKFWDYQHVPGGPAKRLVRIRPATRQGEHMVRQPAIEFVSVQSKQG